MIRLTVNAVNLFLTFYKVVPLQVILFFQDTRSVGLPRINLLAIRLLKVGHIVSMTKKPNYSLCILTLAIYKIICYIILKEGDKKVKHKM